MADLALAIATPVAKSSAVAALTATPAKGAAAAAVAADPFTMLMAAAAPAAPMDIAGKLPAAAVPVPTKAGAAPLPEIAEKTGDDSSAKDDADADTGNPDALLALLTTPAPIAPPVAVTPQIAPSTSPAPVTTPVYDSSDSAPAAKPSVSALMATTLITKPATPVPAAAARASLPAASDDSTPAAPTTQTSIHALVQMMTAQADSAPVQQQVAAQVAADSKTDQAANAAPQVAVSTDAAPTEAESVTPVSVAKPISQTLRMIAPKLDRTTTVSTKAETKTGATATKAETRESKAQAPQEAAPRATTRADATPQPLAPQQAAADAPARDIVVTAKAATSLGSVDSVVTRHLAVARDGQWLDSLAKDIAATGGNNSNLSFMLSPEHLGSLKVDILSGSDGASVHMTTDNDTARNIILEAQPRLAAEARAQGLTLKETSVSTNSDSQRQSHSQAQAFAQSSGQQPGGQDRRAYAPAAPQATSPTLSTAADEESDGDLYA